MADARAVMLTAAEAAPLLGVKPATIESWYKRGHIHLAGLRRTLGRKPVRLFWWGEMADTDYRGRNGQSLTKAS